MLFSYDRPSDKSKFSATRRTRYPRQTPYNRYTPKASSPYRGAKRSEKKLQAKIELSFERNLRRSTPNQIVGCSPSRYIFAGYDRTSLEKSPSPSALFHSDNIVSGGFGSDKASVGSRLGSQRAKICWCEQRSGLGVSQHQSAPRGLI